MQEFVWFVCGVPASLTNACATVACIASVLYVPVCRFFWLSVLQKVVFTFAPIGTALGALGLAWLVLGP